MKNANLTKSPITTISGAIMILLAIAMYGAPMFFEVKKDFTEHWYVPLGILVIGVLLVRSPDTIITGAKGVIKNYTKKTVITEKTTEVKPDKKAE
jgi:hypothetical protein